LVSWSGVILFVGFWTVKVGHAKVGYVFGKLVPEYQVKGNFLSKPKNNTPDVERKSNPRCVYRVRVVHTDDKLRYTSCSLQTDITHVL